MISIKFYVHFEALDEVLTVVLNKKKKEWSCLELKKVIVDNWNAKKKAHVLQLTEFQLKNDDEQLIEDENLSIQKMFTFQTMKKKGQTISYADVFIAPKTAPSPPLSSSNDLPPPLEPIPDDERHLRPPRDIWLRQMRAKQKEKSELQLVGACAHCRLPFRFAKGQTVVHCKHCGQESVVVTQICAHAECSVCGSPTVRKLGEDELICAKCGDRSLEGRCGSCQRRYVFPSKLRNTPKLPCSTPSCGHMTPTIDAIVKDIDSNRRTLLPIANPARKAHLVGGSDVIAQTDAVYLIVQPYVDSNKKRCNELMEALAMNLDCNFIKAVICLCENMKDLTYFKKRFNAAVASGRLILEPHGRRLTIADAVAVAHEHESIEHGSLCVVANADIYFDHSLSKLADDPLTNHVLALSRHDVISPTDIRFSSFLAPLSQDAWIFRSHRVPALRRVTSKREKAAEEAMKAIGNKHQKTVGGIPLRRRVPNAATLTAQSLGRYAMGLPGTDNRLVYELNRDQVKVRNNCSQIIVYHLHNSQVRHYNDKTIKVPPPYNSAVPC